MNDISPNREPQSALPAPSSSAATLAPSNTPSTAMPVSNTTLLVPISDNGPDRTVILTPAQQLALECLFEGGSISSAAKCAGVTRQTVNRWIRVSIDFKTVYDAWHREINKSIKDRMAAIGDAAMDNITNAVRLKQDLRASEFVVKHLLGRKEK